MTAAEKARGKKREPYVIQAEERPERYARGWYVIGSTNSVSHKPRALNVFGTRLVAYRGKEDGEVHILDAYCPHMGGDLCGGEVKGNSVICPFHLWSWGADGVCDDIPYAKKIPEKAVISSWPVLEKNGLIFVWQDPEGNGPIPEQEPERLEDWYSEEWTDWEMQAIDSSAQAEAKTVGLAPGYAFFPCICRQLHIGSGLDAGQRSNRTPPGHG